MMSMSKPVRALARNVFNCRSKSILSSNTSSFLLRNSYKRFNTVRYNSSSSSSSGHQSDDKIAYDLQAKGFTLVLVGVIVYTVFVPSKKPVEVAEPVQQELSHEETHHQEVADQPADTPEAQHTPDNQEATTFIDVVTPIGEEFVIPSSTKVFEEPVLKDEQEADSEPTKADEPHHETEEATPPPQKQELSTGETPATEQPSKKSDETPVEGAPAEETETPSTSPSDEQPQPEKRESAYNPETGEINWDCPCLGGMATGPCGEEFKEAFSCFVYSTAEPKGIDCVEKFQNMQNCFRANPEYYADQLKDEEEAAVANAAAADVELSSEAADDEPVVIEETNNTNDPSIVVDEISLETAIPSETTTVVVDEPVVVVVENTDSASSTDYKETNPESTQSDHDNQPKEQSD